MVTFGNLIANSMRVNRDHSFNYPVVFIFGPEYGIRHGEKLLINTLEYSICGPVIVLPALDVGDEPSNTRNASHEQGGESRAVAMV